MATEQQLNVKLPPPPIDPKKRIMSKDINTPNPSFRVYYGGASVAVPFTWETAPGTPKHHNSSDNNTLQIPLSPPPSFYAASINSAAASRGGGGSSAKRLLLPNYLVKALSGLRSSSSSISSYSSARSYSLSFSSASTATTSFSPGSLSRRRRRSMCFSCSRLPVVHHGDVNSNDGDDDEEVFEEEGRKSNCDDEGGKRKINVGKRRSLSIGGGWDSIGRMRNVLFGCGGGGRS